MRRPARTRRNATTPDPGLRLLGLATRAGGVVAGIDLLRRAVHRGQVQFAVVAADLSANGRDRVVPLLERAGVAFVERYTRVALGEAVGRGPIGAAGVVDEGLARRVREELAEAGSER